MMAAPVVIPELQWSDANGQPYAGGTITTYVAGTSTPKATWADPAGAALNSNPLVLDAAGRSLMWGDGDYRIVLHDAAGTLIFDIPATTIVSAAMAPVVSAPTLADAMAAFGVTDAIDTEAGARVAADNAEAAARTAADSAEATARANADSAEATARASADATLTTNLNAEIARAEAAEAALGGGGSGTQGTTRAGHGTADSSGNLTVTFTPAFPNGVAVALLGRYDSTSPAPVSSATTLSLTLSSWSMQLVDSTSTPIPLAVVYWYAVGW